MRHIFIINPEAGQGIAEKEFLPKIKEAVEKEGCLYEIHITTCVGDAKSYVQEQCQVGDAVRFYACGGDGTLNEVINGAFGYKNAQIATIPAGTGNDFCRNFSNARNFIDMESQINGQAQLIDVIQYNDKYGINMVNIGFDSEVVMKTSELKKYPLLSGSVAYIVGVFTVFVKKMGKKLTVLFDDGETMNGVFLLTAIANGGFCGGGFHSAPKAALDDGLIDVSVIEKMPRMQFIKLLGRYKEGTHLNTVLGRKYVHYKQCKSLRLCSEKPMLLCVDGEITSLQEIEFSVLPRKIYFSVPRGSKLLGGKLEEEKEQSVLATK